jgi:hypothetical protein
MTEIMTIASFDIGKKNFSFCVEEVEKNCLIEINNDVKELDKNLKPKHNKDGTNTDDFSQILDKVYMNGEIILHKNLDLTYDTDKKEKLDIKVLYNMNDELDFYSDIWEKCDYVVIEQQMSFGKKINLIAIKIAQHCASYFIMKYPNINIIEFPSYHKTQVLGAEKEVKKTKRGNPKFVSMSKPKRKKWAVNTCKEILENKGDLVSLERINKSKKKDDLADTYLQLQAFKYLYFVENNID